MNQQDYILQHLKTHKKGITSIEAIERYGCTRLSAVVSHLRHKGNNIVSVREPVKTRYGKVSIARYFMGD